MFLFFLANNSAAEYEKRLLSVSLPVSLSLGKVEFKLVGDGVKLVRLLLGEKGGLTGGGELIPENPVTAGSRD